MAASPARVAAFDILLRIERAESFADELLHSHTYSKLSRADHGLATELVMGALRWRSLLDQEIQSYSSQPLEKLDGEVLTALRLGAYQIQFLSRIPARAAVHESVELVRRGRKRSAVGFANAVLRKLAEAGGASRGAQLSTSEIAAASDARELGSASSHPLWLIERWTERYGLERARQICGHDQQVPPIVLRISNPDSEAELREQGIELAPGKLLSSARIVVSGDITKTAAFGEGRVAIQDEGSQLVALLVGKGQRILDCCAAPGGKTRVLAERNPASRIVAAELHEHRARLLRRLVPSANVEVIRGDARHLPPGDQFDRILADVPCSGTGTLARNPEIKWRLRPGDLVELHARQLAILQSAMSRVARGGRLVYSTCSLETEENIEVVEQALAGKGGFRVVAAAEELGKLRDEGELNSTDINLLVEGPYLRTIPGIHPSDGFFAAILERVG
jgi:16S rRNA (cytosine967-C5)-methyltransferase